ncbi:MAG: DUF4175 family protein [Brumimicrobium sp.]|nr:DUF4175 family protein [Brumimicrobium sp.]
MIRGLLLFFLIASGSFLIVSGLEYIGRFNSAVRAVMLFSFIGLNTYVLIKNFIIPLSRLYSFGKRIDRYQAAKIIGRFFPNVNDKLLNTLQLQDASVNNPQNIDLLRASVEQSSKRLSVISFTRAIDYGENKRYLRFLLPLLLTFVLVGVFLPGLFTEGPERLLNYNTVFAKEAGFSFELENKELVIEEGSSIELLLKLEPKDGQSVPDRIYVESSEGRFLMDKSSATKASYTFSNVTEDIKFYFEGNGVNSRSYAIKVARRTSLGKLTADIVYPAYLERKNETVENPGDLVVPEGTRVVWNGYTNNAKKLSVVLSDTSYLFSESGFRVTERFLEDDRLTFILMNAEINKKDSLNYSIDVIKDEYPKISLNSSVDSSSMNKVYFNGKVSDDYGVSRLNFTYKIQKPDGSEIDKTISVPAVSGMESPFSMTFDLSKLGLGLKDRVSYYFTVYDNDGVNGSKSTRSNIFKYEAPSSEELQEKRNEDKENAKEEMEDLIRQTREFNEQMNRLKKDVMNSEKTSWQQLKQIEQLKKQQQSLEQRMKDLQKNMQNSFEQKESLSPMDEELLNKQELIQQMMEEMMDEELKSLLEELEELMKNQESREMLEKMQETEMNAEQMERQLDRTMEMLKRMDVEERVEDLQKNLEELSKQQDNLREKEEQGMKNEDAQKEQEKLNKEFDKLKEDLNEMLKKNEELNRPMEFEGLEEDSEEVSEDMKKAKENLEKNNEKKAGENQKSASEQMKEMASKMAAMMASSKQEQNKEDMKALRALLENLIQLSFDQEENLFAFNETGIYDPRFVELGKIQRSIMDNMRPVEDSLRALAGRVPKIASFVEQELADINKNFEKIPSHIGEREKTQLNAKQQFVMTSLNNLALFLNEALQSMQQDMQSMMSGSGSCEKPGGKGKGSEGEMEGMKEMLKKQLEEMKKGNQPGGDKPGEKPGEKPGLLPIGAQQAAKMAAQQSAIRKRLEEIRKELNEGGKGEGNQLNKLLEELEEQEKELVNKNWNAELIERQQEILTRLLESEKAIKERGFDEQRESISGKNKENSNQIEFLEYKKQKEKQIELLRTLDPSFSKYYRDKANQYFLNMN